MHPHAIWTIFRKDLFDAVRDGRVLVALLVPLGLGIFYNTIFDAEVARPSATAVFTSPDPTRLPDLLREVVGEAVDLEVREAPDEAAVRRLVAEEEADLGLILPAGFDAAVAAGRTPTLGLARPEEASFGSDYVAAVLDEALRRLAGVPPPAAVETAAVPPAEASQIIFDRVGPGPYFVITSAVFLAIMVALFAVPIILTEEAEKRTLDALVMIASYADVIVAKALVGLVYTAVATVLLLALTGSDLADPLAFGGAIALLSVALIGFGLLMGGLLRSANQLNTWSSVILLPFVGPVYAVGLPVPDGVERLLDLLPTSQATRLTLNALTGERFFAGTWLSYLVIAAWGLAAYALVLWRLSRREG